MKYDLDEIKKIIDDNKDKAVGWSYESAMLTAIAMMMYNKEVRK